MPLNRITSLNPPAEGPAADADIGAAPVMDPMDGSTDPAKIDRLFREHNDALLRVLNARLRSPQEAREVAQEAYVQLLGLNDLNAVLQLNNMLATVDSTGKLTIAAGNDYASSTLGSVASGSRGRERIRWDTSC